MRNNILMALVYNFIFMTSKDASLHTNLNQDVYPWHRPGDERVVITVQPEAVTKQ